MPYRILDEEPASPQATPPPRGFRFADDGEQTDQPAPPATGFKIVPDDQQQAPLLGNMEVPDTATPDPDFPAPRALLRKANNEAIAGAGAFGQVVGRAVQSAPGRFILGALSRSSPEVPGGVAMALAATPEQTDKAFTNLGVDIQAKGQAIEQKYDAISKQVGGGPLMDMVATASRSIAPMLPAIPIAFAASPGAVVLGYFPLLSFDSSFQMAKKADMSDVQAFGVGTASAVITAAAGKLLGPTGEGAIKGKIDTSVTGILSKVIESQVHGATGMAKFGFADKIGQGILQKIAIDPEKPVWEIVSDAISEVPANLFTGAAMAAPASALQAMSSVSTGLSRSTRMKAAQAERQSPERKALIEREGLVNSIMKQGGNRPPNGPDEPPGGGGIPSDSVGSDIPPAAASETKSPADSNVPTAASAPEPMSSKTLAEHVGDHVTFNGYFGKLVRDDSGRMAVESEGRLVELPYHESTPVNQTEISEVIPKYEAFIKPKGPIGITEDNAVMVDGKKWRFRKDWQNSIQIGVTGEFFLKLVDDAGHVGTLDATASATMIDHKLAYEIERKNAREMTDLEEQIANETKVEAPAPAGQRTVDDILNQHHNANVDIVDTAFRSSKAKRPELVQKLPDAALLSARSALENIALELQENKHASETIKVAEDLLSRVESELTFRSKLPGKATPQPSPAQPEIGVGRARVEAVERQAANTADIIGAAPVVQGDLPVVLPEKPAPKPRRRRGPEERPPDLIDDVVDSVTPQISIKSAREFDENFKPFGALRKLFTHQGGLNLDDVLAGLHGMGLARRLETETDLLDALKDAADKRISGRKARAADKQGLKREESQRVDFEAVIEGQRDKGEPAAGPAIPVNDFIIGEEFELAGEKVKVKDLVFDPDTEDLAYVVLDDGRRFDVQTVGGQETIRPDKGTYHKIEPNTDFLPPEESAKKEDAPLSKGQRALNELKALRQFVMDEDAKLAKESPKLRPGEKQGDVFANQEEPIKLVGEKGVDQEKVDQEKAKAEKDAAEAKAIQDKNQPELPGVDIVDRLEAMKIKDDGSVQSSILPGFDPATFRSTWNTALDIAIKAIKAGRVLRDAVKDAVEFLKTKVKPEEWDESAVIKALMTSPGLSGKIPEVETQVQGTTWRVMGKDTTITGHDIESSRKTAEEMLGEAGFVTEYQENTDPRDGRVKGYVFVPKSGEVNASGERLIDILKREIRSQHSPDVAAAHLAGLINSIRDNFRDPKSGFAEMEPRIRKELFRIAQREASYRGAALGALSHFRADILDVAQNVDVYLDEAWRTEFGGEEIESVVDDINAGGVKKARENVKRDPAKIGIFGKREAIWDRIEALAKKGKVTVGDVIREIAKARGWPVPSERDIETLRQLAAKEQWLRTLSPDKVAATNGDPVALQRAQKMIEAATRDERLRLLEKMQTMWKRFEKPLRLSRWFGEHRMNNAQAAMEWIQANLLLRPFFGTRQMTQIMSQMPVYKFTRALGNAWVRGEMKNPETFWQRFGDEMSNAARTSILSPVLTGKARIAGGSGSAGAQAALFGRGEGRDVEQLMGHGARIFDRMKLRAEELEKQGHVVQSAFYKLLGFVQYGYRVAQAVDAWHGTPAEYQEMAHEIDVVGKEMGWNRAQIAMHKEAIMGGMSMDFAEAQSYIEALAAERGDELSKAKIRERSWNVVKAMAYQKMRELDMPADEFEERNASLRNQIGWNLPETKGLGGIAARLSSDIRDWGNRMGIPLPIAAFGNAIGTAINRGLHFTPLYWTTNLGKGKESPWWKTPEDRAQRRAEALLGTMIGLPLFSMAAMGMGMRVQLRPPTDPEDRALWENQGHKAATVEILTGPNTWFTFGLTTGPLQTFAPYLAAGGALYSLLEKQDKKQKKLDAEAAKEGVPAGKVKPISAADLLMVAAEAAWQTVLGGRTASGMLASITDYGTPNALKTVSGQISPFVPGLPAFQEIQRARGVNIDAKLATMWDFMVPLETSHARRINMFGDPVGTQDGVQRVIQMATGGNYFANISGVPETEAYRTLAMSEARPPSIDPNKGYLIDGTFRPMTDTELEKFTLIRGQKMKEAVEGVGSVEGMDPIEAKKTVQQALRAANRDALQTVGVENTGSMGGGSITGGPGGALKSLLPGGISGTPNLGTGLPGAEMGQAGARNGLRRIGKLRASQSGGRSFRPAAGHLPSRRGGGLRRTVRVKTGIRRG